MGFTLLNAMHTMNSLHHNNRGEFMSMLTIRNIEESLKSELRITAAKQGVSMEEQARIILREALIPEKRKKGLGRKIHQYFADVGGIELELPKRSLPRQAPDFSEL